MKTSRGLSKRSQAVRDIFKLSKSPVTLLVEEVPSALGYELNGDKKDDAAVAGLSQALTETLRELKYCFSGLKDEMRQLCAHALHFDSETSLAELRRSVYGRYKGLEDYTIDRDGVRAFILRLIQKEKSDEAWFDGLLTFLGRKSIDKWSDNDRDAAEYRLTEFSRKLNDLEKLRVHYQEIGGRADSEFEVYLIRSIKKGAPDYDEVVAVDSKRHKIIKSTKQEIAKRLEELGDKELGLAALAEVVDEFLAKYRESNKQQPRTNKLKANRRAKGAK